MYEPSEDTFLLLDALESDLPFIDNLNPTTVMEIGPGSGLIITALAKRLQNRTNCFAVDISANACTVTWRSAEANNVKVHNDVDLIRIPKPENIGIEK